MGIEHYLVCEQCKEYIDLHKAYDFSGVIFSSRPTVGVDCKENGFNDRHLKGGYWESRGLWFLWNHRGHIGIEMYYDCDDEWFDKEPYLKEVFNHDEDLNIRKRVNSNETD